MLTTWPTHEEAVPKMPCGRRKLNASCKRTRYRYLLFQSHLWSIDFFEDVVESIDVSLHRPVALHHGFYILLQCRHEVSQLLSGHWQLFLMLSCILHRSCRWQNCYVAAYTKTSFPSWFLCFVCLTSQADVKKKLISSRSYMFIVLRKKITALGSKYVKVSSGINYFNIWFNLCYLSRNYKLTNCKFSFLNLKFQFLF